MKSNRRDFLKTAALGATGFAFAPMLAHAQESTDGNSSPRPNIIYILADDLGYGNLGCYGQEKIQTPVLDRMAREGIRFTHHYSGQAVCTPSRYSLMVGQHMGHCRSTDNPVNGTMTADCVTIPMLLKEADYHTCMIGKWGLLGRPNHPGSPNNKGFDHFFGYDTQGYAHYYYPEFLWRNDQKVEYPENVDLRLPDGTYPEGKGTYSHDELVKEALGYIRERKDKPFFLYLPFTIPHAEYTVPMDSMEPYLKQNWQEVLWKEGGGGTHLEYGRQFRGGCAQKYPMSAYAGMVSRMDRDIGRILALLDELKLTENTIVMFSSDNGPGGNVVRWFGNAGLRGAKRSIYEGGTRVPFIARWPGKIQPGRVSELPSHFCDLLPTFCDMAGVKAPARIDGESLLPELLGTGTLDPKRPIYYLWQNREAIRVGKWKLIRSKDLNEADDELFDLESDPGENLNLAAKHPEIVSLLLSKIDQAVKPYEN